MIARLFTLDVTIEATGQSGRVFTRSPPIHSALIAGFERELAERFTRQFVDDEDRERLPYLRRLLEAPMAYVEAHPGETAPYEIHIYTSRFGAVATDDEDYRRFVCVLYPPDLFAQELEKSNAIVFESASTQVIDGASHIAVAAGLERWCRRMWPEMKPPVFWVRLFGALISGTEATR